MPCLSIFITQVHTGFRLADNCTHVVQYHRFNLSGIQRLCLSLRLTYKPPLLSFHSCKHIANSPELVSSHGLAMV